MESVAAKSYRGWRGYWKRKRYHRLTHDYSSETQPRRWPKNTTTSLVLGQVDRRRRRRWRVKLPRRPKIRSFIGSPKKWLTKLRDAYVRVMMRLANSGAFYGGGFITAADYGGFAMPKLKEYDEKVIVEIYKSIVMAQGQIVTAGDGGRSVGAASQIVWSR